MSGAPLWSARGSGAWNLLYNCMNVPVGRRALQLHTVSRTTPSFARPDAPHVSRDAAFIRNPRPPRTLYPHACRRDDSKILHQRQMRASYQGEMNEGCTPPGLVPVAMKCSRSCCCS